MWKPALGMWSAAPPTDPAAVFLQYGVVGVAALGLAWVGRLLLNRLLASFAETRTQFIEDIKAERARGDRLEAAFQQLVERTQGANVEAMHETATALQQALVAWERDRRERRDRE